MSDTLKNEFGDCACGRGAIVKINDTPVCEHHVAEMLTGVMKLVHNAFNELKEN